MENEQKMWEAVYDGDILALIEALSTGVDVNVPPPENVYQFRNYESVLLYACANQPEIMKFFMEHFDELSFDLSKRYTWGEFRLNVLGLAIMKNNTNLALELLQLDPTLAPIADEPPGFDAFMLALRKHNKTLINHLIDNASKYKINFNKTTKDGMTPLMIAMLNGNTPEDVQKIILRSKRTINVVYTKVRSGYYGQSTTTSLTALKIAIEREYYSLIKLIVESGAVVDLETMRYAREVMGRWNRGPIYDFLKQEYDKTKVRR